MTLILLGVLLIVAILVGGVLWLTRLSRRQREASAAETARLRQIALPIGPAWRALLDAEGMVARIEPLAPFVRQAVRLETHLTPEHETRTRIGGAPDLPDDFSWPTYQGAPLAFVAQIDLAEITRVAPGTHLPPDGYLWFFYVADQSAHGYDPKHAGAGAVVYAPAHTQLRATARTNATPYASRSVRPVAFEDPPDLEGHPLDDGFDERASEMYIDMRAYLASGGEATSHKLLGHANTIQGRMELECELVAHGIYCGDAAAYKDPRVTEIEKNGTAWRLLLQIDSDAEAGMMWGDTGTLYFWIRESDLIERRFDRCWTIMQFF